MDPSHSSLTHTRTPKNRHTQELQHTVGHEVAGEGLAVDDGPANYEADEEGTGRRQKDVRREFSIRNPFVRKEDEETQGDLEAETGEIHNYSHSHGFGEDKGGILAEKGVDLHTGSSSLGLGFRAAAEYERSPEEDETTLVGLAVEDDDVRVSDNGEDGFIPKEATLTTNMENTFGKEAVTGCFSITAPVFPKPRRQVWRNLLPSSLSLTDSMENRTGTKVDNQSSRSSISDKVGERILMETMGNDGGSAAGTFPTNLTIFRPTNIVNNVLPEKIEKTPEFADVEYDTTADADADITADVGHDTVADTEADIIVDLCDDVSNDTSADAGADVMHDISNAMEKISTLPTQERAFAKGLFVGNIPLNTHSNMSIDDKIVDAFNNSSRKTLSYIPPTIQNGEVVVRPTMETIRNGSTKCKTTAVGYFLGKRPYFYHVKDFAYSVWPGLREVKATMNGFFFFQFKTVAYMEEAIEGGPWFFQGQPIVMQKWEPGMVMRKLKHT
ncbi:UNVERIFIED_CONTAM: hypothetical protein Sindi_0720700 [Sesamum indicum]